MLDFDWILIVLIENLSTIYSVEVHYHLKYFKNVFKRSHWGYIYVIKNIVENILKY